MTQTYSLKDIHYLQNKELRSFRRGRVSVAAEIRRQTVLRTNFERYIFRRLQQVFRRFLNTQLFIYTETGFFSPDTASNALEQELFPVMVAFYRRIFLGVYNANEELYNKATKDEAEAVVFGRSRDIERLVNQYFNGRQVLLSNMSRRQSNAIRREIERLRLEDKTLPEIARAIQEKFSGLFRSRAALIARTETHNAQSRANHLYHAAVQEELGLNMMKRWVAVNDERTRSFHADANGQTVAMDEDFIVGGAAMAHAGDSKGGARNVINCRCVIVYVDENDVVN